MAKIEHSLSLSRFNTKLPPHFVVARVTVAPTNRHWYEAVRLIDCSVALAFDRLHKEAELLEQDVNWSLLPQLLTSALAPSCTINGNVVTHNDGDAIEYEFMVVQGSLRRQITFQGVQDHASDSNSHFEVRFPQRSG